MPGKTFDDFLVPRARSLRQTATKPETTLFWNCLRNSSLCGAKFRRQFPIGPYIADFCCYKKKLIIELDGDSHDFSEKQDAERTKWLNNQGYRVLRFSNDDVLDHIEAVLAVIERELNNTQVKLPSPQPSPGGRGRMMHNHCPLK